MQALLSLAEFQHLAGLSQRHAERVLSQAVTGERWRDCALQVSHSSGELAVRIDSLPADLKRDHYLAQAQSDGVGLEGLSGRQLEVATYRYSIIARAAREPKKSQARSAEVQRIVDWFSSDPLSKNVSASTVRRWLSDYESGGLCSLAPASRCDKGNKRAKLSRRFDQLMDERSVPDELRAELVAQVRQHIASLWASGGNGWPDVLRFAERFLADLLHDRLGLHAPQPLLNRRTVEAYRNFQLVAVAEQDAKAFFDLFLPRIQRTRDSLRPLDLVIGDVHPIDVMLRREDGSEVYPRAIGWHDVATNRVFWTLILLAKKEGVRQVHVAQSFASLCDCWGFPRRLYLDNGSEYNWHEMLHGFTQLSKINPLDFTMVNDLKLEERHIIRSRPYNAPAKSIEGLFSVLEQGHMRYLQGWTGGDRTNKKTHNVGKEPVAYTGSWEQFHRSVETALEFYHKKPQSALANRSPNQVLADFIQAGWGAMKVSTEAMLFAFATEFSPKADRGRIKFNKVWYYHDKLLGLTGQVVKAKVAKHDPSLVFVFDPDNESQLLCAAQPEAKFNFLDADGAIEQSRRAGVLRRQIGELKQYSSRLDMVDEMAKWSASQPDAPAIPTKADVTISDDVKAMLEAAQKAREQTIEDSLKGNPSADSAPLSQWISDDA
ncbi:MAG: Mu transposase C-terminal domain-containing protein, partial [Pseudomonadota bacterium]